MTTTSRPLRSVAPQHQSWAWWPLLTLRVLAALALVTSGYIHLNLASTYSFGPAITQGQLFIAQGIVAILIAIWLLVRDSWPSWLVATGLMAGSCAAVIFSTMHRIPSIGPLPSLYEPAWYPEKTVSAVVEGAFVVLVLARFAIRRWGPSTR